MKRLKAFLSGICLLSAMFVLASCSNANTEKKSNSIEKSESEDDGNSDEKSESEDDSTSDGNSKEGNENILQQAERQFYYLYSDVDPNCVYISSDGSCLKVDTNPNNIEGGSLDLFQVTAHEMINGYLELPESLSELMSATRAIDGMQTRTYGNITVSWHYHPDKGLEAIYELTE